ncbi:MAG: preprotein translocase subunit SecG [Puniceicoccales bacterium]|jgi:preprotein translocase subunit SecG|nr:preprotein translocase subunit SecG [Puniceicoccales bacterium]
MVSFLIPLLSAALVLVCAFTVLLVLLQRPSEGGGFGGALGGGALESALGGGAGDVLARGTARAIALFFLLSLALSLLHIHRAGARVAVGGEQLPIPWEEVVD